jgi:glycosyltransferase involved in cell wall biosynthesis
MKTVLVYAGYLLPWSETFIREQVLALREWHGVLVGMREVHQLPLDGLDLCLLRPAKPDFSNRLQWKLNKWLGTVPRSTVRRLQKKRPLLLHVHFGVEAITAWPIAKALDLPMLVTLHGYDINVNREWWEAGHGGLALRDYPSRLLELAHHPRVHFIAVSDAIQRRAISYGIPTEKILVQYIGIDLRRFTPGGRPIVERIRRVLFVGRLVEKKGCEYLIRAFSKVQALVPDAQLVIVGDGPLRQTLEDLARKLGIHVDFRGVLSNDEVLKELRLARVLCLPSVTAENGDAEGLPIVLLEAQASGVPVVTSARGGTEGIRDGVTGTVFSERDVDELRTQLVDVLTDDKMALSMAEAGPPFITKKFDIVQCTDALEKTYDLAVQEISRFR